MAEIVPYTVQYPVRFYSGGDTVSEAVYKHIQEFESLYGKLTDLNTRKAESSEVSSKINDLKKEINTDLKDHINSTDPHPNLTFSKIGGKVTNSQIDSIATSKLTGNIDASRVDKLNTYVYNNITITIGSVTTLDSGQEAWVMCTKTSSSFVLNFGIPKGPQGPKGSSGSSSSSSSVDWGHGDHANKDG